MRKTLLQTLSKRCTLISWRNGAIPVVVFLNNVRLVPSSPLSDELCDVLHRSVVADSIAFLVTLVVRAENIFAAVRSQRRVVRVVATEYHFSNTRSEDNAPDACSNLSLQSLPLRKGRFPHLLNGGPQALRCHLLLLQEPIQGILQNEFETRQ